MFYFFCILSLFVSLVVGKNEEYMGHRVYNIKFSSVSQQEKFYILKSDLVDYWRKPSFEYGTIGRAMVPPSHFDWFEERLAELGVEKDVFIPDVYAYLNKNGQNSVTQQRNYSDNNARSFDYTAYYRYEDILNHLRVIAETHSSAATVVELTELGVTEENRSLVYLRITNNDVSTNKSVFVIEAAINPRDWITVPSAVNIVERLVNEDRRYLNDVEWVIIPVLNPDGYEYTHTNLRLWSKSRSLRSNLGFICPGVNINRNFDLDWMHFDSSSSPCSHLYGGIDAFSEPETQFVRRITEIYGSRIRLYVSLQNNGGIISYPWQYERAASGMFRHHHLLALDMANSMNDNYTVGVSSVILGDRASGTSVDYVRDNGVLYTFNLDIAQRDNDVIIPESEIRSIVDDVWRGIVVAVNGVL